MGGEQGDDVTTIEFSISCSNCVRQDTPDCEDCLVSYVVGEETSTYSMQAEEGTVVALLTTAGLVPALKYRASEERHDAH